MNLLATRLDKYLMKLKSALGVFSEKYKEPSVCESCGDEFVCGATLSGCWCMNMKVSDDGRAEMKEKFNKCLCPKCLGSYASEPAIFVRYPDGKSELIPGAVRVDTQNFHEGMYDFYDERGNLLKQISMNSDLKWETVGDHDEQTN